MYDNNNENNFEQNSQIDWANVQIPKKESFFKRHGFVLGFLSSLLCVVLAVSLVLGYLGRTGNILIVGENGASTVKGDALLTDEIVEKIDELYSYMNVYYYEDVDKEIIDEALYSGLLNSYAGCSYSTARIWPLLCSPKVKYKSKKFKIWLFYSLSNRFGGV